MRGRPRTERGDGGISECNEDGLMAHEPIYALQYFTDYPSPLLLQAVGDEYFVSGIPVFVLIRSSKEVKYSNY